MLQFGSHENEKKKRYIKSLRISLTWSRSSFRIRFPSLNMCRKACSGRGLNSNTGTKGICAGYRLPAARMPGTDATSSLRFHACRFKFSPPLSVGSNTPCKSRVDILNKNRADSNIHRKLFHKKSELENQWNFP